MCQDVELWLVRYELFDSESVFKLPIEMQIKVQKRRTVEEYQLSPLSLCLPGVLPPFSGLGLGGFDEATFPIFPWCEWWERGQFERGLPMSPTVF